MTFSSLSVPKGPQQTAFHINLYIHLKWFEFYTSTSALVISSRLFFPALFTFIFFREGLMYVMTFPWNCINHTVHELTQNCLPLHVDTLERLLCPLNSGNLWGEGFCKSCGTKSINGIPSDTDARLIGSRMPYNLWRPSFSNQRSTTYSAQGFRPL